MIRQRYKRVGSSTGMAGLLAMCLLVGCAPSPQQAKERADKDVYRIIDSKWDEKFGQPVNYRVGDVEPAEGAIAPDTSIPESGILTLEQAVTLATAHNRDYQAQKEDLYLKALDLRLIRHEFELQYFGQGFGLYNYFDSIDGVEGGQDIRNEFEKEEGRGAIKDIGGRADFAMRLLLATGARIGARITANWAQILTDGLGTSLVTILTTEIVQPVLRGSDREVVLEKLTQAERDTLYQIRTFNHYRKTFVVDIITRYYHVLQLQDETANSEQYYQALKSTYQRLETLAASGLLPRHELEQARQDMLGALDKYVKAKKVYQQALDEFKIALSLPTTAAVELDPRQLRALIVDRSEGLGFEESEAIKAALNTRLDLANGADSVLDAERKVRVAADALGMELNIVASATYPLGDSKTGKFGGMPIDDVIFFDETKQIHIAEIDEKFAAGFEFDLGLERVAEENAFRKALINLAKEHRAYEQATSEVVLDVRAAYRNLEEARDRYLVQSAGLELSQQRVDNTFLLLQYTTRLKRRATTRDLLDAQKDLLQTRNETTAATVDYNISLLEFYRDVGLLQVKPDGMWQAAMAANSPTSDDGSPQLR